MQVLLLEIRILADRIKEYEALGIDTFVLSGYPHLEEAYEVAELLFPLLKEDKKQENKIVGEMIADAYALKIVYDENSQVNHLRVFIVNY